MTLSSRSVQVFQNGQKVDSMVGTVPFPVVDAFTSLQQRQLAAVLFAGASEEKLKALLEKWCK